MPIDFGGTGTTGINAVVYNGVRKLLGIKNGSALKIREVLSQLPEIESDMREAMHGDIVALWRQAPCLGLPVTGFKEGTLSDGTPCVMPDNFNPRDDGRGNMVFYKEYGGRDLVHPYKKEVGSEAYDHGVPVSVRPSGYHAFARVYHPLKGVDTVDALREFD
jgi:uroporphyrinogen decarboxylase